MNHGGGIRTITPDIQNDHHHNSGGGVNNMSYSFHGSGSVVLGGGLHPGGPGSGLGGSGIIGQPPEGYVSANVFSVSIYHRENSNRNIVSLIKRIKLFESNFDTKTKYRE